MQSEQLDDIVQRLAEAKYALAARDEDAAGTAIDAALALARQLLSEQRGNRLVRSRASGS